MKKSAVYIAVLLIILIVAAVLCLNALSGERAEPQDTDPTPTAYQPTEPPAEPEETPTQPPVETERPTPIPMTQPPIETREPIATPEPTKEPVDVDASGSFASDTGTYLNILVEWHTYTDGAGNAKLTVEVSSMSYAFYTDALYNAVEINVAGETYLFNSPSVNYSGSDLAVTPMASVTVDAPSGNANISVTWHYRGTYSGVELNDISASGTAYIG